MFFKIFNIYHQAKELKKDPVGFGTSFGREIIGPIFVVPILFLAGGALLLIYLWYMTGWFVFIFFSFVVWFVLLGAHMIYKKISKIYDIGESKVRLTAENYTEKSKKNRKNNMIDVDAK